MAYCICFLSFHLNGFTPKWDKGQVCVLIG